jgi:hypothetical protein
VGVTIDATVGVELVLEGFTKASSVEHSFLNVPLFNDFSIFDFPPFCIPFGSVTGVCLYTPQSAEDAAYMASEDSGGVAERSELVARSSPNYKRNPYWISCDPARTEIRVQMYPSPYTIGRSTKKYTGVPIIKIGIIVGVNRGPPYLASLLPHANFPYLRGLRSAMFSYLVCCACYVNPLLAACCVDGIYIALKR